METRLLNYFLTVAEEQNITRAAKKLNITQPTLSRQMKEFEENLQTELFVRQNKKLQLTEAGMFLKKRAEEILELNAKTERELFNYQETILNGQVSIGCVEAENSYLLAQLIEEMRKDYPQVTFTIFSGTSNDILEKLDKGLLDVAILIEPTVADKYHTITLPTKEVWGLFVSKKHSLADKSFITPQEVRETELICSSRKEVLQMFCSWGNFAEAELTIVGRYNLIFNVLPLVERNVGAALAIAGAIHDRESHIKFLPFAPSLETNCVLVWKKDTILSSTAQVFLKKFNHALKA
jgi:DNA-binding transcriptional LysR family regulator